MSEFNKLGSPFVKRFYTRLEAARALGVTVNVVSWLERSGRVTAVRIEDAHGFVRVVNSGAKPKFVFRAEDVHRLREEAHVAAKNAGALSAAAFSAFRAGKSVADVVISLRLPPKHVEELHASWRRLEGGLLLPQSVVDKLRGLGFHDVSEGAFVPAVERLIDLARAARRGAT